MLVKISYIAFATLSYIMTRRVSTHIYVIFVAVRGSLSDVRLVAWQEVIETEPTSEIASRMGAITPDQIARIIYTSG